MKFAFRRPHDSADSPPYLSLLKLHTPPFATRVGTGFFYADAERTQYLDMLQHLTQYSEELLLVVGESGFGKSALLDKYLERSEEHWRLCRLNGEQGIDLDGLFHRVAECFAVELTKVEVPQLLEALRQHLDALLEQQLSVLVVDDAHALSDDALEMVFHLAALEGEHGKLIRVLLFADSAIEPRLATERFAQIAPPHRLQLKPLDEADSRGYLLHRLQQAGYNGASPFSAHELKQLYRQAHGVPAILNQAAHDLLLERLRSAGAQSGLTTRGIRMGVAATALIGTVLGMHDRINDLLGADANSSMAVTAERPVLRLADGDNPWAVVIRDGESIQISCGAPAAHTVAVRPLPAAMPLEMQMAMNQPLIRPVSAPQETTEESTEESPPQPLPPVAVPAEAAPVPAEPPIIVAAAEQPSEPPEPTPSQPLVIKPPVESIAPELPAVSSEAVPAAVTEVAPLASTEAPPPVPENPPVALKPLLDSVLPSPVIGSDTPQTITLLGQGLEPGSKVAVSWGGKVKALEPSQIVVRDANQMELTLTTGVEPALWAVQVSSPANQRSNVLHFSVETPTAGAVAESPEVVTEPAPEPKKASAESLPAKPAVKVAAPAVAEVVADKPRVKKRVAAVPSKKPMPLMGGQQQDSRWVAMQPDVNFTLQLLAASEQKSLQDLVDAHPELSGPLGRFEQQRGGKPLYVLTQGSYPSRAQAEAAAKGLTGDLKPWIRDFAGIKRVMTATSTAAVSPALADSGGIKDTAWVWSQNPTEYTIQLAGASDEASIEAVMAGLSLPGELAVVQSLRDGAPWYALIYGRFASKESAQGTAARLPAALRQAGPWIRQFSALQSEIAQASER